MAASADCDAIRRIYLAAFSEEERGIVSELAIHLLDEDSDPPTISLVAESDDGAVGHAAFSPVKIDGEHQWHGSILAPLAVLPDYQRRRIGSKLIDHGIRRLLQTGVDVLFVYGDPDYYGRFGFSTEAASPYIPPHALHYPSGWQAINLKEGASARSPVAIRCVPPLSAPELW
jgi:putative acetyltransferase